MILGGEFRAWFEFSVICVRLGVESGPLQSPCSVLVDPSDEDIFSGNIENN